MSDYQVPKEIAKVTIDLPPGPPMDVNIFLSPFAEHHQGQETVSDLFRDSSPFLPVRDGGGKPVLVRKKAVRSIRIHDPERVEWIHYELREGAPREHIRVEFMDGSSVDGFLSATTPEGHQRVSDVVNLTGPYIHLEMGGGVTLVNLAHVNTIRIVEEPDGSAG